MRKNRTGYFTRVACLSGRKRALQVKFSHIRFFVLRFVKSINDQKIMIANSLASIIEIPSGKKGQGHLSAEAEKQNPK
jgi:hypothetical protein